MPTADFQPHYQALAELVGMYGLTLPPAEIPLARAEYLARCLQVRPLLQAKPQPDTSLQIMGSYLVTGSSLAEVIEQLVGFVNFSGAAAGLELIKEDFWRFRFTLQQLPIGSTPYAAALPACYALSLLGFLSWMIDAPLLPSALTLIGPAPQNDQYLRRRLGCPLYWQGQTNELTFSAASLAQPQLRDATTIAEFFERWHQLLLLGPMHSLQLRERVHNLLRSRLPEPLPNFTQAARELGYAPTSFRRQLQRENCSFQQLKDSVRAEQARYDLLHTTLSIDVIATHCGFSESSNFHQAFKRWYGITPAHLREAVSK